MKRQVLLLSTAFIFIVIFTNATTLNQNEKSFVSSSKVAQSLQEEKGPITFIFRYTKRFYHAGCLITATFSVSITFNTDTGTVVGVTANLISGSVDCPETNEVKTSTIDFTYSGSHVNTVYFSSDISQWEDAMNSIEQEVVQDVNDDIDSILN